MANQTSSRDTPKKQTDAIYAFPVKGGAVLPQGTYAVLDSTGFANVPSASTALIGLGRVKRTVNNTGGSDGADLNGNPLYVEVEPGTFRWDNGDSIAQAQVGARAYIGDNHTVYQAAASKSLAGAIVEVTADGVWVRTDEAMVALASALSVTLTGHTTGQGSDLIGAPDPGTLFNPAHTTVTSQLQEVMALALAALPVASFSYVTGRVLVAGDVAVTGVTVTASSVIVPIREVPDTTAAHWGAPSITTKTIGAGTGSFHIHSASVSDTSTFGALIIG